MTRRRRDFLGSSFFLTFFILFPTLGLAIPSFSADLSDREEDGLLGDVRSVETRESLLVQTDRYDPIGRLIERVQDGVETSQGLWPLRPLPLAGADGDIDAIGGEIGECR